MTTLLFPLSSARSLIPPAILFGVTPHYYIASTALRLLKPIISQNVYEKTDSLMYHSYQSLVTYFFETFSGTKIYFYGDSVKLNGNENVLYLCNHQSAIDWSIANFVAIRQGALGKIRYIMKGILKYLPFFGPYFFQHGCIFVHKSKKGQDADVRRSLQRFMKDRSHGYWLVIFPEGTRFSLKKADIIKKGENMAKELGEEPFRYVLFPRTKAVELSLEQLTNLDAVYDLTIAFKTPWLPVEPKKEGPSLLEFVSVYGREVHMHFNRIPIDQIPTDSESRKKWLYSLFRQKDRMLHHFYDPDSNGQFPGVKYELPLQNRQVIPYAIFYTSLLIITMATESGRRWYVRSWMFGFGSLFCMPVLYRLVS